VPLSTYAHVSIHPTSKCHAFCIPRDLQTKHHLDLLALSGQQSHSSRPYSGLYSQYIHHTAHIIHLFVVYCSPDLTSSFAVSLFPERAVDRSTYKACLRHQQNKTNKTNKQANPSSHLLHLQPTIPPIDTLDVSSNTFFLLQLFPQFMNFDETWGVVSATRPRIARLSYFPHLPHLPHFTYLSLSRCIPNHVILE
jgi:hypothetical protein